MVLTSFPKLEMIKIYHQSHYWADDSNEGIASTFFVVLQLLGFIGCRTRQEWGKSCFEHGKRNDNQQQKYHFLHQIQSWRIFKETTYSFFNPHWSVVSIGDKSSGINWICEADKSNICLSNSKTCLKTIFLVSLLSYCRSNQLSSNCWR